MFHNTTTIWHNQLQTNNFSTKEKRLAFGFFAGVKESFVGIGKGIRKGGEYAKGASKSWPARLLMSPITYAYKYTAKGASWLYDKVTWTGICAKEAALGVFDYENSVARGFGEVAWSPVEGTKRLFVNNFRHIIGNVLTVPFKLAAYPIGYSWLGIKALFTKPLKFLRHPINTVTEMKNSVVSTVKTVRDKTGSVLDDVMGLHFIKLARRSRDAVFETLKKPAKAVWAPIKTAGQLPYDIVNDTGHAGMSYAEGIEKFGLNIRDGFKRILNAPEAASAEMNKRKEARKAALAAIEGTPAPAPAPA